MPVCGQCGATHGAAAFGACDWCALDTCPSCADEGTHPMCEWERWKNLEGHQVEPRAWKSGIRREAVKKTGGDVMGFGRVGRVISAGARGAYQWTVDVVGWVARQVSARLSSDEKRGLLEGLQDLAVDVVEYTGRFDLDGDGHVAAAAELRETAARLAKPWATRLASMSVTEIIAAYDAKEILRWLAIARLASAFLARFGGAVPSLKILSFVVEAALVALDIEGVAASLEGRDAH